MVRAWGLHRILLLCVLFVLILAGCNVPRSPVQDSAATAGQAAASQPAPTQAEVQKTTEPTPTSEAPLKQDPGLVKAPPVSPEVQAMREQVVQAIAGKAMDQLHGMAADAMMVGVWRYFLGETTPDKALQVLYSDPQQAGKGPAVVAGKAPALAADVDLATLLGGKDPLSLPKPEWNAVDAFLATGWGPEGRDEAIIFLSGAPDGSLKWLGWIAFQGGLSRATLGGVIPYQNDALGFAVFVPAGYTISEPEAGRVTILGPEQAGDQPGAAFLTVTPTEELLPGAYFEAKRAEVGNQVEMTANWDIDGTAAIVISGLPGQDPNRQLFMVRDDVLYRITFMPDGPQTGDPYRQMEDIYAMITNTFHFEER
jgi:hypothetical protein